LSALYSVLEGRGLFLRERSSNFYTPQTWIVSRVVFDIIPLRIIPTLVLSIIVYFMIGTIGIDANAATFFKYLLVAFLFTIVMVLYNFLLAAVITHGGIAVLLSSLWNLLNFVYAGFFVNTKQVRVLSDGDVVWPADRPQMPAVLRWIKYIVPLNYALEALTVNWINFTIEDVLSSVPISINAVAIMETLFGFDVSHYYRYVQNSGTLVDFTGTFSSFSASLQDSASCSSAASSGSCASAVDQSRTVTSSSESNIPPI
jgi:hypothetical protein